MSNQPLPENKHELVERNTGLLMILIVVAISFATLVEIVPTMFQKDLNTPLPGMRPWTPLAFEGRDIYIREGCHVCHTQMVRPLRAEVERYGTYSRAGESTWDHPFLWGSKRTGPDLARVGGKYSDDWQREHLRSPRSLVAESVMPAYPHLAKRYVDGAKTEQKLRLFRDQFGVPYSAKDLAMAKDALQGKTEEDALVAYLQQLGHSMNGKR